MKTIFIGSTPNLEKEDLDLTKKLLRGNLKANNEEGKVTEKGFKKYLNTDNIYFTNTGRTSLYLILKTLGIKSGDEVITQSFSCMAASQPILWVGAKPVFADIERKGFNIDIKDIKKKITSETRAIIVQHLFGLPIDIKNEIDNINKERTEEEKIYLIEDCAHSLGSKYEDGSYVGSKGDFAYFSFSQDKIISSVQGGGVVCNNNEYKNKLENKYSELEILPDEEVRYLLKYRVAWEKIKRTYAFPSIRTKFSLGRLRVLLYRRMGWIKPQVNVNDIDKKEVFKMSDKQKLLLENQLAKFERLNSHREDIVGVYNSKLKDCFKFTSSAGNPLLRYPILVKNTEVVRNELKKKKVIIGNWYNHPIYPKGVSMNDFGYQNDCPVAEEKCRYILNLPTNIAVGEDRAIEIAEIVNKYAKPFKF